MNKFIVPAAVVAIIAAVGVITYTLGVAQSDRQAATSYVTPAPSPISETPVPTSAPTSEPQKASGKSTVIENIQAAVQSKNYAALEGYMADNVNVLLYATECCGIVSKKKAIEQLSYLNGGTPPWDFSSNSQIAQKLINADPANFTNRIIGIASNGMVVSFSLNSESKIDKIFISADYKLISP